MYYMYVWWRRGQTKENLFKVIEMEKREFKKESGNKSVEVSHKGAGVQSGTLKIEQVRGGSRILCRTKFGEGLES